MKRPLQPWNKFPGMAGESRRSRRIRRAQEDPEYKAHLDAIARMPDEVKAAWDLYFNDTDREIYPYGFAYHFPRQWRWMELEAATVEGKPTIAQHALKAAGLGPDTVRAPDGHVDRWPSGRPMGMDSPGVDPDFDDSPDQSDRALWCDDDGTVYWIDRLTGEILCPANDNDPPF
jgi:hypothetical protein